MKTIIIHPKTKAEALKTIFKEMKTTFEKGGIKESPYSTAFEKKMDKAKADKKTGRYKVIKTADLWK